MFSSLQPVSERSLSVMRNPPISRSVATTFGWMQAVWREAVPGPETRREIGMRGKADGLGHLADGDSFSQVPQRFFQTELTQVLHWALADYLANSVKNRYEYSVISRLLCDKSVEEILAFAVLECVFGQKLPQAHACPCCRNSALRGRRSRPT
jgi:hypothetical protein